MVCGSVSRFGARLSANVRPTMRRTVSDYRIVAAISFYQRRIDEAKELALRATESRGPEIRRALAAVLLAVALEDAIRTKIAERCANAEAAGESDDLYRSIRSSSLRTRMTSLAAIIGKGFFGAPGSRKRADALHRLINVRNRLLHVDEIVHELDEHDEGVALVAGKLEMKLELPTDPWSTVTEDEVTLFVDALEHYVQEVLDPLGNMDKYWTKAV